LATFYGAIAILMWGGLALLGTATANIPAFQLLFLCFTLSASLMFLKRLICKQPLLAKPNLNLKQWAVGISGLFGFHFCYFMALKQAPAIEVSLISYIWPMLFALFISTRANIIKSFIGSLMGFVGIYFIIFDSEGLQFNQAYLLGYVLAACCALIWSGYSYFQSHSNNSPDDIGWLSIAVACLSLVVHFQLETSHWKFSNEQLLGIIFLGIGPVGGAFYLWDISLKKGNKKLLASLSYCAPLISASVLSIAGLNSWSSNILISLVFILVGGVISNQSKFSRKPIQIEEISLPKEREASN